MNYECLQCFEEVMRSTKQLTLMCYKHLVVRQKSCYAAHCNVPIKSLTNQIRVKCVPAITNLMRDQGLGSVCVRNCHLRLCRIMITFTLICSKYLIVFPFNFSLFISVVFHFIALPYQLSEIKSSFETYCTLFCQMFKIMLLTSNLLNCFLKYCLAAKR